MLKRTFMRTAFGCLALSALLLTNGCASHGKAACGAGQDQLATLEAYLTGSFDSSAQADTDPENYFNIHLNAARIWPDRDDGRWLYVEQAAAQALERPYRVRVYRLSREGDAYRSEVYKLPGDELAFQGAFARPIKERLASLSPEDLAEREGCAIVLTWDVSTEAFRGSTLGTDCASSLGEASYATSEVVLFADRLETWDRGWTQDGEQAWGAVLGPYEFVRSE